MACIRGTDGLHSQAIRIYEGAFEMLSRPIVSIGFDKNGEADYALQCGELEKLDFERMQQLRAMLMVAVGQVELIWRETQAAKPENQAVRQQS